MEENRIPQKVCYMNFETTRLRRRPRSRWQDEVKKDGRLAGGKGWGEKVHNREEWKKLLRTARNHGILHMPMNEWTNEWMKKAPYSLSITGWHHRPQYQETLSHPTIINNKIVLCLSPSMAAWTDTSRCRSEWFLFFFSHSNVSSNPVDGLS